MLFGADGKLIEYRCYPEILKLNKRSFDQKLLTVEGLCLPDTCLLASSEIHFKTYCGIQARDPSYSKYEIDLTIQ